MERSWIHLASRNKARSRKNFVKGPIQHTSSRASYLLIWALPTRGRSFLSTIYISGLEISSYREGSNRHAIGFRFEKTKWTQCTLRFCTRGSLVCSLALLKARFPLSISLKRLLG